MDNDLQVLRREILKDRFGLGYAAMRGKGVIGASMILDRLNRRDFVPDAALRHSPDRHAHMPKIKRPRVIKEMDVINELPNGAVIMNRLRTRAGSNPQIQELVTALAGDGLDVSVRGMKTKLQGLAKALGLRQSDLAPVTDMAMQPCSHAEYVGLEIVTMEQLIAARVMRSRGV